jgi:hypothetical protein
MHTYLSNTIDALFPPGKAPHLNERSTCSISINGTSSAAVTRVITVRERAHVFAAGAIQDCPTVIVNARNLFLDDEYSTFTHRAKCLTGMIVAYLYRRELIPLEPLPGKSSPRRYRIIPELIDFDLVHSLISLRS